MEVRRLGPGDEDVLRTVRLAALTADPVAFWSTLAREEALGPGDWTRRLGPPSATFVVVPGPGATPVGMAWGVPADDPATAHLMGMWVAPAARGTGAADRLVEAVVAWAAAAGATTLALDVVEGNERAERLYRRHGFGRTGTTERRPHDGVVEVGMARALAPPPPDARAAFGIVATGPAAPVAGGVLHRTWRVPTGTGAVALKVLADGGHPGWAAELERAVAFERAVWAAGTVPMAEPLLAPGGATAVPVEGGVARAHRWVEGPAGTAVAPTPVRLRRLGRALATLVVVGAGAGTTADALEWNALDAYDETVAEAVAVGAPWAADLVGLAGEVERLRAAMADLAEARLPMVLGHGDLHPRNSVVAGGRDVLLDWDEVGPVVPVSHLLDGALAFAGGPHRATEALVAAALAGWEEAGGGAVEPAGAATPIANAGLRVVLFHAWRALGQRGVDAAARAASAALVPPLATAWARDVPALRSWERRLAQHLSCEAPPGRAWRRRKGSDPIRRRSQDTA